MGHPVISYHSLLEVFAKLSFNFNYNLVESWDSINFIFNTHPTTRRKSLKSEFVSWTSTSTNTNTNLNQNLNLNLNLNPNFN